MGIKKGRSLGRAARRAGKVVKTVGRVAVAAAKRSPIGAAILGVSAVGGIVKGAKKLFGKRKGTGRRRMTPARIIRKIQMLRLKRILRKEQFKSVA